jgi:sucrose-6-phosphate hydrolase SacC (GH32 family)
MEVFVNGGRECVTRVIYPGQDALGIEVFADGGAATARSVEVWQLGSVWP